MGFVLCNAWGVSWVNKSGVIGETLGRHMIYIFDFQYLTLKSVSCFRKQHMFSKNLRYQNKFKILQVVHIPDFNCRGYVWCNHCNPCVIVHVMGKSALGTELLSFVTQRIQWNLT